MPTQFKRYDKRIMQLEQQIKLEYNIRNGRLYLLDKNSFVLAASFQPDSPGRILRASRNAYEVLQMDSKVLQTLNVSALMPRILGQHHNRFILNFLQSGKPKELNTLTDSWILNNRKQLLEIKKCVKIFFQPSGLELVSYLLKQDSGHGVLLDEFGEIDSIGEYF